MRWGGVPIWGPFGQADEVGVFGRFEYQIRVFGRFECDGHFNQLDEMSIFGQSEYDGQFDQLNIPVLLFDFSMMASLIC